MKHSLGDFEAFLLNTDRKTCQSSSKTIIKRSQSYQNQEQIQPFTIYKHLRASFNKRVEYSVQIEGL